MPKKTPLRQCLGCREMKPKAELMRVVRSPEGTVSVDLLDRQIRMASMQLLADRGLFVETSILQKAHSMRQSMLSWCMGTPISI